MSGRTKFLISGVLIAAAVTYAIVSSSAGSTASYFLTVEELLAMDGTPTGRTVTVSGAVLGDSIQVDPSVPRVTFTIAHVAPVPDGSRQADRQEMLHASAIDDDPAVPRINVVYDDVRPQLLQGETRAIIRGQMGDDGVLHADEVLLKCPTRYEETAPIEAH